MAPNNAVPKEKEHDKHHQDPMVQDSISTVAGVDHFAFLPALGDRHDPESQPCEKKR
ncbi:MAG: hypothetical protein ABSH52_32635 [Terriglobia bacterium]|jgi:hypothetical protein